MFEDQAFLHSNKLLGAVMKEKKREGREPSVVHKEIISDSDLERLKAYFEDVATCDPHKLTYYVWHQISSHFCLRGSEIQCKLLKSDLVLGTDGSGVE